MVLSHAQFPLVKESGNTVVMFDESLNTVTKRKQMDVHIRSWIDGQVISRYLTSQFMGHATADDVVAHFRSALEGLLLNQILQISMDGPNVNWKFFEKFQGELKREFNVMLLNVGSCGLHVVHGAFKYGSKASGWDVDRFMGSAYWLFKDTPARREDYESTAGCKTFPVKFCQHRWLENGPVCERLIALLPHLEKYVKSVAEGKNRS